jgi:hypothetical protein
MNYDQLIQHYGSAVKAATVIESPRQTVYRWRKSGCVPLDQQCLYELDSGGKLIADLPAALRELIRRGRHAR